jgi:ABC-2 type transport system permease protein
VLAKWVATIRIAWQKQLVYKLNFLLLIIGPTVVFCFVKFNLWDAVFSLQGIDEIQGYRLSDMLHYQLWGMIVGFLGQGYNSMNLAEDIRLGRMSTYLVYPFGFWPYHTASFLAFQILQVGVSVLTVGFLRATGYLEALPLLPLITGFGFSLYVGFLWFQISFALGLCAFWLEETWVLRVMFVTVAQFLSGSLLPLEIFPSWLARGLRWTPFPYMTYVPVKIFMGSYAGSVGEAFLILSVWLALISLLVSWIWRRGLRLYTAAGM